MTVKELIKKLQEVPENTEVLVENSSGYTKKILGFERGSFSWTQSQFTPSSKDDTEESNAILLL